MKISVSDIRFVQGPENRLLRVTLTLADGEEGFSIEGCLVAVKVIQGQRRVTFQTPRFNITKGRGYYPARLSQGWSDAVCAMFQNSKYFEHLSEGLPAGSTAVMAQEVDPDLPVVMTLEEDN